MAQDHVFRPLARHRRTRPIKK